jgi:hypothetical protein
MNKKTNHRYRTVAAVIFAALSLVSSAQGSRLSKTYNWEYALQKGGKITIDNYDCDIKIHTWENNEVKYELSVQAEMNSPGEAGELDSYLKSLNFSESRNRVDINNRFWEKRVTMLNRKTITLNNNTKLGYSELNMSAELWIPEGVLFALNSKYSDITMEEITAAAVMNLYNDKVKGETFGNLEIEAKYSTIELGNTGDLKAKLYDCNMQIAKSGVTFLETKYSTVNGRDAGDLIIDSYDDKISFESAHNTGFTAKYSDLRVGKVSDLILDTYNGSVTVESSNLVRITGKYTTFNTGYSTGCSIVSAYDCTMEYDEIANMRIDESKYTTYTIGKLNKSFKLSSGYDDRIVIKSAGSQFSLFSADGKYVKSTLTIPGEMACRVKADAKYASLNIDEKLFKTRVKIVESSQTRFEAVKGEEKEDMPLIEVTGYDISLSIGND